MMMIVGRLIWGKFYHTWILALYFLGTDNATASCFFSRPLQIWHLIALAIDSKWSHALSLTTLPWTILHFSIPLSHVSCCLFHGQSCHLPQLTTRHYTCMCQTNFHFLAHIGYVAKLVRPLPYQLCPRASSVICGLYSICFDVKWFSSKMAHIGYVPKLVRPLPYQLGPRASSVICGLYSVCFDVKWFSSKINYFPKK
jgi:hypothetical protein